MSGAHLELIGAQVKAFPEVDDPAGVRSLKVRDCKFSMAPIARFANLEEVEIFALPDATLAFLAGLARLRYLYVIHLSKVTDLDGLPPSLDTLRLHTLPGWDSSGKRTVVRSLMPIAELPALRHLELFSVVPEDRSLAPLEACPALVTARFQGYPKKEVARFQAATGIPNDWAPAPDWSP